MTTRREALTRLSVGAVATFAGVAPGLRAIAGPLPIRKEINGLALNHPDVTTLRDGVRILKGRPAGSPNWTDLATIHGTPAGFNKCPHRNWYFVAWHRAYLLMYERIIRAATGNTSFAMPFWDWTAHPAVPQAYSQPTYNGQPNPLYVAQRNNGYVVPTTVAGPSVMNTIYNVDTVFEKFGTSRPAGQNSLSPSWITSMTGLQGTLEGTPHNSIHVGLGGFMPNGNSPMDPIFLMHHGNIDHIWWTWNCKGRPNTSDNLWRDMAFANTFYNPTGTGTWTTHPSQLLDIATLGYSYGACVGRLVLGSVRTLANARLLEIYKTGTTEAAQAAGFQALTLKAQVNRGVLDAVAPEPRERLKGALDNSLVEGAANPTAQQQAGSDVIALIHNLTPPNPGVEVLVFVGAGAIPDAADAGDSHYVQTIGFFGVGDGMMDGHAMSGGVAAQVDLTAALRASTGGLPATDEIRVHLVARPVAGGTQADAEATVANAQVEVAIV